MNKEKKAINIVGAGLSGTEIALYFANKGFNVNLYESKKIKKTPAQTSDNYSELVCSNSFRGLTNAVGELKNELFILNSELMKVAQITKVPAGNALAVNREDFSKILTQKLESHKNIKIIEKEFIKINDNEITIIATGPLTSDKLINELKTRIEIGNLHFYDAIAPIIDASTINYDIAFKASRWQRGDEAEGDYINCPMNKEEYDDFIKEMQGAQRVELHSFEKYFEGCLPIEVMQERSSEQLRYGPMKPVGLFDPRYPDKRFYAVVQLRKEDKEGKYYNIVGFQTKLKYQEQKKVFRKIPGLENVKFVRYGSIHRNTFINAPKILNNDLSVKGYPNLYITGQLSGVEGYVESIAMGMLTAISIYNKLNNNNDFTFPTQDTAFGALYHHLRNTTKANFQPSNINFSLFSGIPLPKKIKKKEKNALRLEYAINKFKEWIITQKFL